MSYFLLLCLLNCEFHFSLSRLFSAWTLCELTWFSENGKIKSTRMWANAQPDGRPVEHEHTWHPLFNAQSLADAHYLTAAQ